MTQVLVDRGALKMALNVLRTNGKDEVADEVEKTCQQIEQDAYRTKRGAVYGGNTCRPEKGDTPLYKAVV